MKKLDFDAMEQIHGGYDYCGLLFYWKEYGTGYQGSIKDLEDAIEKNC